MSRYLVAASTGALETGISVPKSVVGKDSLHVYLGATLMDHGWEHQEPAVQHSGKKPG
jgi:hypothetical protein